MYTRFRREGYTCIRVDWSLIRLMNVRTRLMFRFNDLNLNDIIYMIYIILFDPYRIDIILLHYKAAYII